MQGKKRVERIPEKWTDYVRRCVEEGRKFREAVKEILNANAELLILWRRQKKD
jgi:peroxiredoxin